MGLSNFSSLPGLFFYAAYYPNSSSNYWTNANTSYGNFSITGTIPSPTVLITSNFGTVSKAAGSLPGINFSAPRTGTIQVICETSMLPGQNISGTNWALQLLESGGNTIMAYSSGGITANNANNIEAPVTLTGYFNATIGTTYQFELQGSISAGTMYIGSDNITTSSCLSFVMNYIS